MVSKPKLLLRSLPVWHPLDEQSDSPGAPVNPGGGPLWLAWADWFCQANPPNKASEKAIVSLSVLVFIQIWAEQAIAYLAITVFAARCFNT